MVNPILSSSAYLGGPQAYQHLGKGYGSEPLPSRQSSVGWCLRAALSQQLSILLGWWVVDPATPQRGGLLASEVPACPPARRPPECSSWISQTEDVPEETGTLLRVPPSSHAHYISLTWPTLQQSLGIKDNQGLTQAAHRQPGQKSPRAS